MFVGILPFHVSNYSFFFSLTLSLSLSLPFFFSFFLLADDVRLKIARSRRTRRRGSAGNLTVKQESERNKREKAAESNPGNAFANQSESVPLISVSSNNRPLFPFVVSVPLTDVL